MEPVSRPPILETGSPPFRKLVPPFGKQGPQFGQQSPFLYLQNVSLFYKTHVSKYTVKIQGSFIILPSQPISFFFKIRGWPIINIINIFWFFSHPLHSPSCAHLHICIILDVCILLTVCAFLFTLVRACTLRTFCLYPSSYASVPFFLYFFSLGLYLKICTPFVLSVPFFLSLLFVKSVP